jgi:hypothetical protein
MSPARVAGEGSDRESGRPRTSERRAELSIWGNSPCRTASLTSRGVEGEGNVGEVNDVSALRWGRDEAAGFGC